MKHAPAWILLVVVLAWFWPVPLGARAGGPTVDTHALPLASWFSRALSDGRVPEWNSLDGTGTPATATSEIAPYYLPHQVAYRLLRPATAWTGLLVLHTLAAAVFARLCAVGFGLGRWASLLVGIVFAGQGFFVTGADRGWVAATACWLPLAVWATWRWLETGSSSRLLGLTAVLGIQLTAGHFQVAWMTLVTVAMLSIGHRLVTRTAWTTTATRCGGVVLAMALAAALSAAQLVPSAELAAIGDTRGRGDAFLGADSTPPWHLLAGHLAPTLTHSDPLWLRSAWTPWKASPSETLGYVGLLTIGLAVIGLIASRTDRRCRLWGVLLLIAMSLSIGRHLPGFAWLTSLPGFSWFPAPGRWSVVAGLWWAMLAGRGLEQLDTPRIGEWCQRFSLSAAIVLALSTWVIVSAAADTEAFFDGPATSSHGLLVEHGYTPAELMMRSLTPATEMTRLLVDGLAPPVLALAILAAVSMSGHPIRQLAARPGLIVFLVALDLGGVGLLLRPVTFTWDSYDPATSSLVLERLGEDRESRLASSLGRLPMAAGLRSFPTTALADIDQNWKARTHSDGTQSLYGWPRDWWPLPPPSRHDTLGVLLSRQPSRHDDADVSLMQWTGTTRLVSNSQTPPPSSGAIRPGGTLEDTRLSELQHGRRAGHLPGASTYTLWQLDHRRPASRGWFIPLDSPTEPGSDPTLERQPPPVRRDSPDAPVPVESLIDNGEVVELTVRCSRPGAVVVADQAYPGWRATRTPTGSASEPVTVETAWGHWRMVRIPAAGHWTIRFTFASASHQLGRRISLIAGFAWIFLAGAACWPPRLQQERLRAGNAVALESTTNPPSQALSSPEPGTD